MKIFKMIKKKKIYLKLIRKKFDSYNMILQIKINKF